MFLKPTHENKRPFLLGILWKSRAVRYNVCVATHSVFIVVSQVFAPKFKNGVNKFLQSFLLFTTTVVRHSTSHCVKEAP